MKKYYSVDFDDVDHKDYPDYADAFVSYAEHEDGTPFSEDELTKLNEDSYLVRELLEDWLY